MPYIFKNVNPNDDLYAEDCVTRAIQLTTGLKYEAVTNLLNITSYLFKCPKLCLACYKHLLTDIFLYKLRFAENDETVEEIANLYKDKKVIIRIEGHLTAGIYGYVMDSFDCSQEPVDCYWVID